MLITEARLAWYFIVVRNYVGGTGKRDRKVFAAIGRRITEVIYVHRIGAVCLSVAGCRNIWRCIAGRRAAIAAIGRR
jgi:hypothetical protein